MDNKERGRPKNLEVRKCWCEIVQGVVYEDRCLWKLSGVIEGSKACEDCILREVEKLKSVGAKPVGEPRAPVKKRQKRKAFKQAPRVQHKQSSDIEGTNVTNDINATNATSDA